MISFLSLSFFVRLFDTGAIPVSLRARDNSSFVLVFVRVFQSPQQRKITYSLSSSFPHDGMDLLPSMTERRDQSE